MLSGHYGCDNRDGVGICRLGGVRFREVGARPSATASCRRLFHAVEGLRANEICAHNWVRSGGYKGACPNCGFEITSVQVYNCTPTLYYRISRKSRVSGTNNK